MILYDNDILNDLLLSLHLYDNLSEYYIFDGKHR